MFRLAIQLTFFSLLFAGNALACGAGVFPVFDDNTVLLGQEKRTDFVTWSDFGGKMDGNETPALAAAREFREETAHYSFPGVTKEVIEASDFVVSDHGYTMFVVRVHGKKPDIQTIKSNAIKARQKHGKNAHVEKFDWCYVGVADLLKAVDSTPYKQLPLVPGKGVGDTLYRPFVKLLKTKHFRDIIARLQPQQRAIQPAPVVQNNNNVAVKPAKPMVQNDGPNKLYEEYENLVGLKQYYQDEMKGNNTPAGRQFNLDQIAMLEKQLNELRARMNATEGLVDINNNNNAPAAIAAQPAKVKLEAQLPKDWISAKHYLKINRNVRAYAQQHGKDPLEWAVEHYVTIGKKNGFRYK